MPAVRSRLVEYALVTAFLAIAAAGAVALFGEELRAALGVDPRSPSPPAHAAPSARAARP